MAGDKIIVQGSDIAEEKVEAGICEYLGLPQPEPKKKGLFDSLLKK